MKRIFVLAFIFCNISAAFAADSVKAIIPPQKVLSSENGRFIFGQVSEFRADQYMLDTKTGRMWRVVYDGTTPVLEPVLYLDQKDHSAPRTVEPKEK